MLKNSKLNYRHKKLVKGYAMQKLLSSTNALKWKEIVVLREA